MLFRRVVLPPDGGTWRVGRRVSPWRPRWVDGMWRTTSNLARTPVPNDPNFANLHGNTSRSWATGLILVLTLIAGVFEAIAIVLVSVIYVPVYVATRVIGRRPWTVTAHRVGSRTHREWTALGWRATEMIIGEIVDDLEHQRTPRAREAEQGGLVLDFKEWVT